MSWKKKFSITIAIIAVLAVMVRPALSHNSTLLRVMRSVGTESIFIQKAVKKRNNEFDVAELAAEENAYYTKKLLMPSVRSLCKMDRNVISEMSASAFFHRFMQKTDLLSRFQVKPDNHHYLPISVFLI